MAHSIAPRRYPAPWLFTVLPELETISDRESESWRSPQLRLKFRSASADPMLFAAGAAAYERAAAFWDRNRDRLRRQLLPQLPAGYDIHHRVELQVLKAYPGVFSEAELNHPRNFLPVQLRFHRSWIRQFWNRRYELLDRVIDANGLRPGTPAYNTFVRGRILGWVKTVDGAVRRHRRARTIPAAVAPPKPRAIARPRWLSRYVKPAAP